jgi:succinoglycan biosynthesis transport protein ExoP
MSAGQILLTLWRRKLIVLAVVLIATGATYYVAQSLPKVYSSSATLFVGDRNQAGTDFEAIQSGQVIARTYAELIQSRNVAARVAAELPEAVGPDAVLDRTDFKPVADTQLVVITAEGDSPQEAAELANVYARVFTDYAAANLTARTRSEVSIADPARQPGEPVRPRPVLYSAVMLVFSLLLGAALALLRDRLDARLGDDEEISRTFGLPVLGRIPRARAAQRAQQSFLENFRVLHTNLTFLRPKQPLTSVLVTSAAPAEGKSTTAFELAQVVGEQGKRVVIIEGDLRRPSLTRLMEVEPEPTTGLTHYLALEWAFGEVVHKTPWSNVYLVPASAVPPNPAALLQPGMIQRLLREASVWADFVIVDSPPLSAGADASILGHEVDGVLFVLNHRLTKRRQAIAAANQLRQARAPLAGIVINEVPSREDTYAYYGAPATRAQPEPLVEERPSSRQAG